MESDKTSQPYLEISVQDLKLGMFVIDIAAQNSDNQVKNSGRISDRAQIQELVRRGVQKVWIDPSRSSSDTVNKVATTSDGASSEDALQRKGLHVRKLYQEAKTLQRKLFRTMKQGETVAVQDLEPLADELVDTIFDNRDALFCLSRIREKDSYLMEHSLNVAMLLANFGRFLGLERQVLRELTIGGMLHDVGKIRISDAILHKPGKLTPEEFAVMKKHVNFSISMLKDCPGITPIMLTVAACHHERLDGQGYPQGLTVDRMNLYARMSPIVDCYDALTADRCYKAGMPPTSAFRILLQGIGTQFDEALVRQFIKCMGVHPVGTLVKLQSGKLAVVMERNDQNPLQPKVKVVYSTIGQHHLDIRMLDLAKSPNESIECAVDPKQFGLDLSRYLA